MNWQLIGPESEYHEDDATPQILDLKVFAKAVFDRLYFRAHDSNIIY